MSIKKYEGKNSGGTHQDTPHDTLHDTLHDTPHDTTTDTATDTTTDDDSRIAQILHYCLKPRSRQEIQNFIGLKNKNHVINMYIKPMLKDGLLEMTLPDKPTSRNQKYVSVKGDKH